MFVTQNSKLLFWLFSSDQSVLLIPLFLESNAQKYSDEPCEKQREKNYIPPY